MLKKTGTIAETVSAEERVAILERDINAALDSGDWKFTIGFYRFGNLVEPSCGCAIGAALHVLSPGPRNFLESVHDGLVNTGFMTYREVEALEDGYEHGKSEDAPLGHDANLFLELGKRLRARPDATPANGKFAQ